ncbi:ChrR family anti-sigma-E factor [Rhizobium sp. 18055]|jgi:putative transcriptional regulator|uniref:ChrR family anti-sigma-E factor n=1 Tax=Rhizobium sp. 18055 TaxID=2681403 RepID=UPI00135B61A8|nr:ChrR family anti-sigma-E factor [Rhizobium sp. 18055]
MIEHHLDDEMLLRYSAGTLPEGWGVAVATHLALCPSCRAKLGVFESVGGYFLDRETAANDDQSDAWSKVHARIEAGEIDKVVAIRREGSTDTTYPEPLRSYIANTGGLKWRRMGGGAAQMIIPTSDPTTTVRLLKIPAGQPVPEHSHAGTELTLVLEGSFSDAVSTFGRGDIEMADSDLMHQPRASEDRDCICLAVTDAPLRFKSRFMRWLQPILGI